MVVGLIDSVFGFINGIDVLYWWVICVIFWFLVDIYILEIDGICLVFVIECVMSGWLVNGSMFFFGSWVDVFFVGIRYRKGFICISFNFLEVLFLVLLLIFLWFVCF